MEASKHMNEQLLNAASRVFSTLKNRNCKLVLAESCTCGLAAAALGTQPGVSGNFCGSAVAYREQTKTGWLDVGVNTLEQFSAESMQTTIELAFGVLTQTPEADFAAAITGNLGPGVIVDRDGQIFMALVSKANSQAPVSVAETRLTTCTRVARQSEASQLFLEHVQRGIAGSFNH